VVKQQVGGIVTRFNYNLLGEMLEVINHEGHRITATHNMLGQRTSLTTPDSGTTRWYCNEAGPLIREQSENLRETGSFITYHYDRNRLVRVQYPFSNDVTYSFDNFGRVNVIDNGTAREVREFGHFGEVVGQTTTITQVDR
jgi:YD repeat-containing protein